MRTLKLTLDQTWTETLKMWKWISEKNMQPSDTYAISEIVDQLKREYMKLNYPEYSIGSNCFFCLYTKGKTDCSTCPGKLVDKEFSCGTVGYSYDEEPVEFYQKLSELDKLRKETNHA